MNSIVCYVIWRMLTHLSMPPSDFLARKSVRREPGGDGVPISRARRVLITHHRPRWPLRSFFCDIHNSSTMQSLSHSVSPSHTRATARRYRSRVVVQAVRPDQAASLALATVLATASPALAISASDYEAMTAKKAPKRCDPPSPS